MSSPLPARPTVVIPADFPEQIGDSPHLDRLRERAEVRLYRDYPEEESEQLRRAREADILLNSRGNLHWRGEQLRQLPQLRMITTTSIGTDSIDLDAARESGIVVSNIPAKTAPVVAEHALALLMGTARQLSFQTRELREGRWTKKESTLLRGKTLGLIGAGSIGAAVARLAQAIGMNVLAWTFHPSEQRAAELGVEFVSLERLLAESDAVSVHLKLTDESRHFIGAEQLARMKPGALLINTARGAVVDTAALVDALNSGKLGGAGLDVFEDEPLPDQHPLLDCAQIVLTPHAADQTPEGIDLLNEGAVDNVLAYLDGQPQNVVT